MFFGFLRVCSMNWNFILFFIYFFSEIRKAVGGAGREWEVGLSLVLDVKLVIL